jgi:hypothetical protein
MEPKGFSLSSCKPLFQPVQSQFNPGHVVTTKATTVPILEVGHFCLHAVTDSDLLRGRAKAQAAFTGFPSQWAEFKPGSGHVGFVVEK